MTSRIYYTDPYCRRFEAVVTKAFEHEGRAAALLDKTAFYPTSGGQPFDVGALTARRGGTESAVDVVDTIDLDNEVGHILSAPLPAMVVGDAGRLTQVLTNLLDNALKFTHDGRMNLVVRPLLGGTEDAGGLEGLEFDVRDTGIGIAVQDQTSIFEVFSQVDPSATRRYEGTGLGLAICKQLTELMGGTIGVASEPGVGSTFTVRLPMSACPAVPAERVVRLAR